jgi:hypothetical protein
LCVNFIVKRGLIVVSGSVARLDFALFQPTNSRTYYLFDTKLAYCSLIDNAGNVTSQIGAIGYEKGNYPSLDDLIVDSLSNRVLILSNGKRSVQSYSLSGLFIKEWELPFFAFQFAKLSQNMFAFFVSQNRSEFSGKYDVMITDSNFKVTQGVFDDSYLPWAVFSYTGVLQNMGKSHLFSMPFSDSIYQIDSDSIRLKYIVSFGSKDFPTNFKSNLSRLSNNFLNYDYLMTPIMESGKYLCCLYARSRRNSLFVFDRISGKLISSNLIADNSFLRIFSFPVGLRGDDEFIFLVDPAVAHGIITGSKKLNDQIKKFDEPFYNAVSQYKRNNNPIIYFLKFKF